VSDSAL